MDVISIRAMRPLILALALMLVSPELTFGNANAENAENANPSEKIDYQGITVAAKKKKKRKKKNKGKKVEDESALDSTEADSGAHQEKKSQRSNIKALVGMFLQDGSQLTFGGSYTKPFGSFYFDLGGDYTSWSTEIIAISLIRGAAGGGYSLGLSQSLTLTAGARAGMAMVSFEIPSYDFSSGQINGTTSSSATDFYAELRAGVNFDISASILATAELQLPIFGGNDTVTLDAMSVYGGLGYKF